jgi:hypothetical protein
MMDRRKEIERTKLDLSPKEKESIENGLLWGFGFDLESREVVVTPVRDKELTFKNPNEMKLFILDLIDQIQLWYGDDTSSRAQFFTRICQTPQMPLLKAPIRSRRRRRAPCRIDEKE